MTSIQNSMTELERTIQLREAVLECYLHAIGNTAQYALEFDDEITAPHRKHMRALAEDASTGDPDRLVDSPATFRSLLRDYRDKASQHIAGLRDELSGTARALEEILESLSQNEGDSETRLRVTVQRLRNMSTSPEAGLMAQVMRTAAESIEQSVEQMKKQQQLTVSQFKVEIRMLHKRIDSLEAAATVDSLTKLSNREEMTQRIKSAAPGEYSLLLINVRSLTRAEAQFGQAVAAELGTAFSKRLRNSLPPTATIGRWGTEEFIAMVPMQKVDAVASGKWITEHLSGAYACLQDGKSVRPTLQLNVGIIDSPPGESNDRILERIGVVFTG